MTLRSGDGLDHQDDGISVAALEHPESRLPRPEENDLAGQPPHAWSERAGRDRQSVSVDELVRDRRRQLLGPGACAQLDRPRDPQAYVHDRAGDHFRFVAHGRIDLPAGVVALRRRHLERLGIRCHLNSFRRLREATS